MDARAEAVGVVAGVLLAGLPGAAREREHLLVLPAAARLLLVAHVHRPVRRGTQGVALAPVLSCALEPLLVSASCFSSADLVLLFRCCYDAYRLAPDSTRCEAECTSQNLLCRTNEETSPTCLKS